MYYLIHFPGAPKWRPTVQPPLSPHLKFNKKGEICYKGKLLKRSNVYDLINHAIHTNRSPPVHMKNFYKILAKIVIPNKLIKNKEGRNIMNKAIHDIDTRWRPPGRLK